MGKRRKEKNVLLLSSRYGISNSANAICVKNIATELQSRGYTVVVLTSSGNNNDEEFVNDGVKVYALKQAWYSKLLNEQMQNNLMINRIWFKFISFFRRIINIFLYPNVSPFRAKRVLKKAIHIVQSHDISTVISTYRPFENVYTAIRLSKKFGSELTIFDFQLDVLFESNVKSSLLKKILKAKTKNVIITETKRLKRVVLPESAESLYRGTPRICFAGFPVYVPDASKEVSSFEYDRSFINISYIGSLSIENRNPKNAFSFISKVNERISRKCRIHIWGNIDTAIKNIIDRYDFVMYHGLIDNKFVMDLLERSDFLLNISNEVTYNMLPSKIFQEFAAKRPIINFVKNRADMSVPFFVKFGYAINIYEEDMDKLNIDEIANRIIRLEKQPISAPSEMLTKYTPSYFVDMIERDLQ